MKTKYLSKAPGNDLLTKCFYKIFWKELKDLYIMSIKQTFHKKILNHFKNHFICQRSLLISNIIEMCHR